MLLATSRPCGPCAFLSSPRITQNGSMKFYVAHHIKFLLWRSRLCGATAQMFGQQEMTLGVTPHNNLLVRGFAKSASKQGPFSKASGGQPPELRRLRAP